MRPQWIAIATAVLVVFARPYTTPVKADGPFATIEDLGSLGGDTQARGINADGTVVGYGQMPDFTTRGFHENGGALMPLATFGGTESRAYGINVHGLVVGFARGADNMPRAFRFDPVTSTMENLGTLGGAFSFAYAINSANGVAGYAQAASGAQLAFKWTDGVGMQSLGTLGGPASFAYGINANGDVVGQAYTAGGQAHGFLYTSGAMQDLGTFGGNDSSALGINDDGVVVGVASLSSSISHAFRFVPGVGMHDLGTLGGNRSSAEAVNSEGTAVGWSTIPGGATRACLWTTVGDILDLNTLVDPALGWVLNVAYGINDEGQIVGYGRLQNVMRPFRLTLEPEEPAETDTTAPTINTMAATPSVLWPAHHQLVPVEVTVDATDDSGEAPVCQIASVLSSEPDNGLGDGDTASDIQLDGSLAVTLRAERSGRGPGRVYTIVVGCGDEAGNQAQGNVVVNVPRSRGQ